MNHSLFDKWIESAENNKAVAKDMFDLGHYSWALFMQHLAIEKLIKALIAKNDKEIPYIHDLWKLSNYITIDFSKIDIGQKELDEITTFNLEARYDDYKFEFYKKATEEYSKKWMVICDNIYKYLRELLNDRD